MQSPLNTTELDTVAEIIWRLCEYRGRDDARARVLDCISQLLNADYAASFVWDDGQQRSTRRYSHNIDERQLLAYDSYLHQADFITPALRGAAVATNVDQVIQRSQLVHSQFYCDFLQPAGMHHGINVYFFAEGRDVGDLRVWRAAGDPPFGEREERLLDELAPYFVRALATAPKPAHNLSRREAEVAELVAGGASDKEVARHLGIAFTTVRTHLNNAMGKLDCANRTQLSRYF